MTKEEIIEAVSNILADRAMPAFPDAAAKAGLSYTDYLTRAGQTEKGLVFASDPETGEEYVYTPRRNRQCSIGYHGECTDPEGKSCGCPCHPLVKLVLEAATPAAEAEKPHGARARRPRG